MTEPVTPNIARSLDAAGIFKAYHNADLADCGNLGKGYRDWVKKRGPELKAKGGVVVFHGLGQYSTLVTLARMFHMNGAGVRRKTLLQLSRQLQKWDEKREEMEDAPTLYIDPAQASGRGCSLEWWQLEEVETYIKARVERGQIVLLHWDPDAQIGVTDPLENWWSKGFLRWMKSKGEILTRDEMLARGKAV